MLPSMNRGNLSPQETPTTSIKTSINSPVTTTTTTTTIASTPPVVGKPPSMSTLSIPKDSTDWARKLQTPERTGVPPLHQTIIDKDYEMAALLLCVGANVMAVIQPPLHESDVYPNAGITQNLPEKRKDLSEPQMPAFDLVHLTEIKKSAARKQGDQAGLSAASAEEELANRKIVDFATYMKAHSPQENTHFAGANALTLCVLSDAPAAFVEKVCDAVNQIRPTLINAPDKLGRTPLCIASAQGNAELVQLLVKNGASVDTPDGQGISPLHQALNNQHGDITKLLISRGADAAGTKTDASDDELLEFVLAGPQGKFSGSLKKQPHPLIIKMIENRDLGALQTYQAQSDANRVAVFKALIWHAKKVVDQGSIAQLSQFLDFASPLLKPMRLAKLAVAIARRPGQLEALQMVLQRLGDQAFPKTRLAALRDAAGESRDPAMLELAISLDPALVSLIDSDTKPSKAGKAKLNRTYALALQTRSTYLINRLREVGTKLSLEVPALKGLPLLAILADYGDPKLLRSTIQTHFNPSTRADLQTTELSTRLIKTGAGLSTLVKALGPQQSPRFMHELLCHAVVLNDEEAVLNMVDAGANPNYLTSANHHDPFGHLETAGPLTIAIQHQNWGMIDKLISLGCKVTTKEHLLAGSISAAFADKLMRRTYNW